MYLKALRDSNYFLFEIIAFFRLLALFIPQIAHSVLIQDKICLIEHNQSAQFCQRIHETFNTTHEKHMKDVVLGDAAKFGNYV